MDPRNPTFFPDYPNTQNYPNFQSFFNTEDYQNSQFSQNPHFSPNLNQVPISEQAHSSQNISRNLFQNTDERATKKDFVFKEDAAMISAWIFVSEDKKRGRFQKGGSFWARVHKMYEEARRENPKEINERNIESLKGRFNRLNKSANKWVACVLEAHGRIKSGMSEQDLEAEAQQLYGGKFPDLHVFNQIMSKIPKWEINFDKASKRRANDNEGNNDEESGGSSKRTRTSEDGEYFSPTSAETPDSGGSAISRPTGRDQAKKKKGKGKASESSSNVEVVEELRALRLTRDNEVQVFNTLGREKVEIEKMKMKHSLLMALLAKDHLSPDEEEMKRHLLSLFK